MFWFLDIKKNMKKILFILLCTISLSSVAKEESNENIHQYKYWKILISGGHANLLSKPLSSYKDLLHNIEDITILKNELEDIINSQGFYRYNITVDHKLKVLNLKLFKPYIVKSIYFYLNGKRIIYDNNTAVDLLNKRMIVSLVDDIAVDYSKWIKDTKCIFNFSSKVEAEIDQEDHSFIIKYYVDGLLNTKFGKTKINTSKVLSPYFISNKLTISEGNCYKQSDIDQSRVNILKTNLFDEVSVDEQQKSNNEIDLTITPVIAKYKTFKAALDYSSEDKVGLLFLWRNKNFNKFGQTLSIESRYSKNNKNASISYYSPYFKKNKSLTSKIEFDSQKFLDFDEKSYLHSSIINQEINNNHSIKYGYSLKKVFLDNKNFKIIPKDNIYSIPLSYIYKSFKTDSSADVSDSFRIRLKLTPTLSKHSGGYIKSNFLVEKYTNINNVSNNNLYLFSRFGTGSIFSKKSNNIINSEKYFLGGAKDIKGYEYQSIGVLSDNHIVGGKSYIYLQNRLVKQLDPKWALGVFYNIGSVSNKTIPNINNTYDSVGITVKYFIGSLPINLDIASNLKKTKNKQKAYQFYLSIGWEI